MIFDTPVNPFLLASRYSDVPMVHYLGFPVAVEIQTGQIKVFILFSIVNSVIPFGILGFYNSKALFKDLFLLLSSFFLPLLFL